MEGKGSFLRLEFVLKTAILVVGAGYTALYFILSIPRLFFPYEIEWMEGSLLDHVLRIVQGKPFFIAPSIETVNWQYQPLFYYAAAGTMHFFGTTFFAGRLVSFVSIIIVSGLIFFIIYRETKSWWYAFTGSSLLFAAYGLTGYWYDVARVDSLSLAFMLASVTFITVRRSIPFIVGSTFFLALAFFTKQQAFFYMVPFVLWLFIDRKRNAIIFSLSLAFFVGIGILLLSLDSGPWYFYYVFRIPWAMGDAFHWDKIVMVFPYYVFNQYTCGSILLLFFWLVGGSSRKEKVRSVTGFYTLLVLAAIFQLGMLLGHEGAYKNAAMPFAAMMALIIPIITSSLLQNANSRIKYFVLSVVLIQLGGMFYSFLHVPLVMITRNDYKAGETFFAELHSIPEDVFFPQHGFYPTHSWDKVYVNHMAALECSSVGDSTALAFWKEWEQAFIQKRYGAIILDEGPFRPYDSIPGYTFVRKVNLGEHPFVTRAGDALSIPRYLYLPLK